MLKNVVPLQHFNSKEIYRDKICTNETGKEIICTFSCQRDKEASLGEGTLRVHVYHKLNLHIYLQVASRQSNSCLGKGRLQPYFKYETRIQSAYSQHQR